MEAGKLEVYHRTPDGKGGARKLRARGLVPGVAYGLKSQPVHIAFDSIALHKALDPNKRHNTVLTLDVVEDKADGKRPVQQLTVMVKSYERDAVRQVLLHADFILVDETKDVHVTVPIVLTGKAEGLKTGGVLHQVFREITVASKPRAIPTKLEIDVTSMNIGDVLHAKDLPLPEGVRVEMEPMATIVTMSQPRAEKGAAAGAATAEGGAAAAADADKKGGDAKKPAAAAAPAAAPKKDKK
jgi:large subunit ribosomal protein L25